MGVAGEERYVQTQSSGAQQGQQVTPVRPVWPAPGEEYHPEEAQQDRDEDRPRGTRPE